MVEPLPSSTVVVVRDADRGPEMLLVRRRAGDAFGDSYTFPGGVLDPDEAEAQPMCSGLTAAAANALLGVESGALDYYSAVVRELLEETGLLLGASTPVDLELRYRLHAGELPWKELLRELGLSVPCDELQYFAHWITPRIEHRDTVVLEGLLHQAAQPLEPTRRRTYRPTYRRISTGGSNRHTIS